jgi:hypothetical protein
MKRIVLFLAALAAAVPAAAQDVPPMTLEQQMLVRCSATFAIVASEQERGVAAARAYPPLNERGKEFFVRAGARLMDELHLSREALAALMKGEVERLQAKSIAATDPAASVNEIMQPCLVVLNANGY